MIAPPRRTRASVVLALAATTLGLVACTTPHADTGLPGRDDAPNVHLTIYAAASLAAPFDELARAFEARHPGIAIDPIVSDGSSTLVTQLAAGAPADIFASADEASMTKAVDAGLLTPGDAVLFASNSLVIAVPAGNPAQIYEPEDLARDDVTLVLCAIEVPCGSASQQLLAQWGVDATPASLEQNVAAVLAKVAASDADAGLVYRSDVQRRSDVHSIAPEGAADVVNRYPIGVLTESAHPDAAAAFVTFVTSTAGREFLARHGFGAP